MSLRGREASLPPARRTGHRPGPVVGAALSVLKFFLLKILIPNFSPQEKPPETRGHKPSPSNASGSALRGRPVWQLMPGAPRPHCPHSWHLEFPRLSPDATAAACPAVPPQEGQRVRSQQPKPHPSSHTGGAGGAQDSGVRGLRRQVPGRPPDAPQGSPARGGEGAAGRRGGQSPQPWRRHPSHIWSQGPRPAGVLAIQGDDPRGPVAGWGHLGRPQSGTQSPGPEAQGTRQSREPLSAQGSPAGGLGQQGTP